MPKSKTEALPKQFQSLDQAGEFWDTHDLADYWEQTEETSISFQLKRKRHLVSLSPAVARDLCAAAKARGVST
ncbi:MAG: CopG family antitoxin, partial [Candidatus Binatia bacterium]